MSNTKQVEVTEAQALITGMPEYCTTMTFMVEGTSYTTPQVVSLCSSLVAAQNAVVQAKAAYHDAVVNERKLQATTGLVITAVRQNLANAFKNVSTTMAALMLHTRKAPAPLSTAALAAKEAKAKATRLARGTGTKKQKAAVTGNVTGVSITPIIEPATSASAPEPATAPAAAPAGATVGATLHG